MRTFYNSLLVSYLNYELSPISGQVWHPQRQFCGIQWSSQGHASLMMKWTFVLLFRKERGLRFTGKRPTKNAAIAEEREMKTRE